MREALWAALTQAALQIAGKELREGKVPFTIRRFLPDGTYEDWGVLRRRQ